MAKFTDKTGDDWIVELDVGLIEDVKDGTGVDFDMILKNPDDIATVLFTEPRKLVEVLYVICEKQCEDRKVQPKSFGYRFDRESLDKAANALIEAIITFYPRASAGRVLKEEIPGLIEKIDRRIAEKMKLSVSEVSSNIAMS